VPCKFSCKLFGVDHKRLLKKDARAIVLSYGALTRKNLFRCCDIRHRLVCASRVIIPARGLPILRCPVEHSQTSPRLPAAGFFLPKPSTGEFPMFRRLMIGAVSALTLSATAFAQKGPKEGQAMLDKAIAAVKADPVVAIAMFIKGEGGFRDGDIYPFCFRIADGKTLASPKAVKAGTDVRSLKDTKGSAYGEAIYAAAQKPEGQITEIPSYMFPKPDTLSPTFEKVSFVTKVGDLGCGVGYYK